MLQLFDRGNAVMPAGLLVLVILLITSATHVQAEDKRSAGDPSFTYEKLVDGLQVPWGMAFISADEMLITERAGGVKLLDTTTRVLTPLRGTPSVLAEGQGGMLDVAVPADYKPGGWIYFTFVRDQDGDGVTVLARARLKETALLDWQDLLVTQSATGTGYHFGSRIAFDDKDHVFFTVGDRGVRANGQDLSNHAATVIRLHRDGRVPKNNPFVGKPGALAEIWSYGHRNPQGIAFDQGQQRLWVIEHGPRGGDEINLVLPGLNYGWPVISYGKEYWGPVAVGEGTHKDGMQQPVKQYTPSIAPGSLILYSGKAFPAWKGNLFAGALKLRHLNRVVLNANGQAIDEQRLLADLNERIRALAEGPRGWIYFSTDSGKIFRIKPAGSAGK
jgi:glucose/arabinose dehydrogenase